MPISPDDFQTGGALQGAVAASLLASRDAAAALAPGDSVGLFRIVRELGRGGMAIVYLAERADGEYRQQVALKCMQAAAPGVEGEALFRRERQALADLRHPHVARLLDGGRGEDGRPWFAMEYVEGERLDDHCVNGALPRRQRLELFLQLCSALAFAHARGVIHRDIKPSNVLVDADGSVKLLDFGIARLLGQGDALGDGAYTPGFASPEQLRREPATVASDIYQLGRLLACLLSADRIEQATIVEATRLPANDADEGRDRHKAANAPLPSSLPADLAAILHKAQADEPTARYASVDALVADVQAFIAHRPVNARPSSALYRGQRFLQRHPLASTATLLALAMLVGISSWFTLRLREQRDLARQQRDIAATERDRAEQALATTEAINRFLNDDLLGAANPLNRPPGAPEATVRQAMDAAESRIETRLKDHPAVLASLLTTEGNLRFEFGDDDHARALYDRAIALAEATPGAEDTAITARGLRAAMLVTLQEHDQAEAELDMVMDAATRRYGSEDIRTLQWELRRLEARSGQGMDDSQIDALRELRQHIVASAGEANTFAGEASLLAAMSLVFAGHADQARADAELAWHSLRQAEGEDHPSTLKALVTLGHSYRAEGRGDEAIDAMRRALDLQRGRYGPDALDSLFMQNELAYTLSALGQQDEAEVLFADLLARYRANPMSSTSQIANTLSNLATARLRDGRADAALAAYDDAEKMIAEGDAIIPQVMVNLLRGRADALIASGRLDQARQSLDRASQAASSLPEDDWRRLSVDGSRARLLLAQGRHAEGLALLDQTLASMRTGMSADHPLLHDLQAFRDKAAGSNKAGGN